MTNQQHDLKAIVEEYVDLKSLNPKPLFETLEYLFNICGEKPVSEYTRDDARQFVKVYGSKVKTTSVRRRLNSLNAVFNYAIYELDLPHRNPFSRIIIKGEGKDATPREPFSVAELKGLYSASLAYGRLRLILPILGDLERQIGAFVDYYNNQRYHESLSNVTPADVYFGRGKAILRERKRIKKQTIKHRRLQHQKQAA